ncbi:MAG: hypothetical protein WKG32_05270 [Gemmatimonadaceae bacterium]
MSPADARVRLAWPAGSTRPTGTFPDTDPDTGPGKAAALDVAVVVLVSEAPEPLAELYEEYAPPLRAFGRRFEFIFAVEPAHRLLIEPVLELARRGEPVRCIELAHTVNEAALLSAAAATTTAPIVVTLPAYRRVIAEALPSLIARVEEGADLVVARRWPRRDGWINRMQNRVLHVLVQRVAGGRLRDVACGVRAVRRDVLREVPLYGEFLRFFPILATRQGYRVEEVDAPQHPRDVRTRVYAPGVYVRRLLDVLALAFLVRFREAPLRFFGLIGAMFALAGTAVLGVMIVQRTGGRALADRPLFLGAALLIVLGLQAIALGLIGEIIVHLHASRQPRYRVKNPHE